MNMPTQHDEPAFDAAEWQAQEKALRAERLGLADDDMRGDDYRRVARALRQPLPDLLPDDFAEHVARKAGAARAGAREWFDVFAGLLLLVLVASGIGYGMDAAHPWWQSTGTALPLHLLASPWLLSLAACAGLTGLLGRLPGMQHPGDA